MRIARSVFVAVLAIPSAVAAGKPLAKLDVTKIPEQCRVFAHAAQPTLATQLAARLSIANCAAQVHLDAVRPTLVEPGASQTAIDRAILPSVALLDEIIAQRDTDPGYAILAARAKSDLYAAAAVRLRDIVPHGDTLTSPRAYRLRDQEVAIIDPLAAPWLASADEALRDVTHIAERNPSMQGNAVIDYAVWASIAELHAGNVVGIR
jgi:hypothetical protein